MKTYILKRLAALIPILLGVTFITFALMYLAPGDPASLKLKAQGVPVSEKAVEMMRKEMGLDKPFLIQYADWLINAIHGNFGTSYRDGLPVSEKIMKAAGPTCLLTFTAMGLTLLVSIPLGVLAAVKENKPADGFIRFLSFTGSSVPGFAMALLLMYFFSVKMKLFPIVSRGVSVQSLALPALALTIGLSGKYVRQVRSEVLLQLKSDYVISAKARHVKEKYILFSNVLHNAWITLITLIGMSVGSLLAGTAAVETVFSWPGLGKLCIDSVRNMDYPVVQGFVIWMAVVFVLINLLTDILYRFFNPRIRESGERI